MLEVRTLYDPQAEANRYPKMLYKTAGQKKGGTLVQSKKEEDEVLTQWAAETPVEAKPVEKPVEEKASAKVSKSKAD